MPKLPAVITFTMSYTFITSTINVVATTVMVGMIVGMMTFQNVCRSVAPSTRAASISSEGTALMAADRMTMAKPVWIQMSTTISHTLLNGASCRNRMVPAMGSPVGPGTEPPSPGPRNR